MVVVLLLVPVPDVSVDLGRLGGVLEHILPARSPPPDIANRLRRVVNPKNGPVAPRLGGSCLHCVSTPAIRV